MTRVHGRGFIIGGLAMMMLLWPVNGAGAAASGAVGVLDGIEVLWTADTRTHLWTAATLADLDGDGLDEIILAGQNSVMVYDGEGNRLWEWATPTRFASYPAVLMRDGAPPLIYVADNAGNLFCLDAGGEEVWRARLSGSADWQAPVVADTNGDGKPEVIQTDQTGAVRAFDAVMGQVRWQAQAGADIGASPSVGNLTGAGLQVAVGAGDGSLTVIDGAGEVLWSRQTERSLGAPVIFTTSQGEGRIVVGTGDGEMLCFDAQGELLWQRSAGTPIDASISVGDLNLDGRADIFVVTTGGTILRLDEDGDVIWRFDTEMRSDAPGAIADITGDGRPEYVVCLHRARLLAFDESGDIIHDQWLGVNNAYNATPTFGNVTDRSPGLEMVICGGDSALFFCFSTPAPAETMLQWGGYRRDLTMAGSWPGLARSLAAAMTPENLAWNTVLSGAGVRFRVTNARPGERLRASAACTAPDGARYAVTRDVTEAEAVLSLPVEVLAPGAYQLSWTLADAEGRILVSGERQVTLEPFANDRAVVRSAAVEMNAAAHAVGAILPLSASALRREARLLEDTATTLGPLQDVALRADAATQRDAIARTTQLVASAQRGSRLARIIVQATALGAGTSIIAFEGPVWESLGVPDHLPERVAAPLAIVRRVVPGEHEPVVLNLLNITSRELNLRVVVEAPDDISVRPLRAFGVPTSAGEVAWDALPELDETAALTIPSLASRQLWLDLAVGEGTTGQREIAVRLQAIDGVDVLEVKSHGGVAPPETMVQVRLDVLPFAMAPPGSFRLNTWAYVEQTAGYRDYPDATYEDLWQHGNNVFFAPYGEAQYDPQGRLVDAIDYGRLDAAVARWRGRDVVILFQGFPALKPASGAGDYGSEPYRQALKPYLEDLVSHMAGLGFPRERFALYPIDEPGGGYGWASLNPAIEFGQIVRAANPAVQIYSNPGGPDPAMMEAIAPYVDIWSPPVNTVATEPEQMEIIRATGKTLWSYNCSYNNYNKALKQLRTLKGADVVSEYRIAAIWAFRHGLTGAGFWTYCTSPEDPWTRTDTEYPMVYPGRTHPVTSRRWEGVREGIEDYRILSALRGRLEAGGLPAAARDRIGRLLGVTIPQYVDGLTDEAGLNRLRAEMLDCVEALTAP